MSYVFIKKALLNFRAKKGSEKILKSLQIEPGNVIADIGSGGGYYSIHFSKLISPDGKVYAVETDKALLEYMDNIIERKNLVNIKTIYGGDNNCILPEKSCDLIFMRNVFHHISDPKLYFQNLRKGIKEKGRIAVVEWSPGGIMRNSHCTPEKTIIKIIEEAGYNHIKTFDFLKEQSYNIFEK